ncbi:hypothetical protein BW721_09440 [Jeotgalibaca sp. PTS2502]|nr:hypothetical protein BW721_09440 [Jeotgalibaca sp. PTS2502]
MKKIKKIGLLILICLLILYGIYNASVMFIMPEDEKLANFIIALLSISYSIWLIKYYKKQ